MKKNIIGLGYFLIATILLILASCTGGNESVIGKPGFFDYFPSIVMILGIGGILYGVYTGYKNEVPRFSGVNSKKWIIWALLVFLFGLATYFS